MNQTFPLHTDRELESIIAKAENAYETDWSRRSLAERRAIVKKAASLLRENTDKYAKLSVLEMGKLLREARWEVALCADILDYYADNADVFLAPEKLLVKGGEAKAPHGLALAHEPMDRLYRHL